jgi:hypothetical protein
MHVAGRRCLLQILLGIVKEKCRFKAVITDRRLILKRNIKIGCEVLGWTKLTQNGIVSDGRLNFSVP